jgi:hypothetical protein
MKKLILPVFILILVTSCATIKVSSDFDKSAQFAQYKTYALTPEVQNLPIEELNRKRLIAAIETEMGKKGFTKSENPDIFVDVKITGEKKQTATATSTGGYGYGGGYRYGWGGGYGGGTTYINYDSYMEGTIFIEMADAAKKELVWQGRGVGTINPDASAKKREDNINYAVKMIFQQYPPKAK